MGDVEEEDKRLIRYPKVLKRLEDEDFDSDLRDLWLLKLETTDLTETQILDVINSDDAQEPIKSFIKYKATVLKHALKRWWTEGNPIWRAAYTIGWFSLLLTPVFKNGLSPGVGVAAIVVITAKVKFVFSDVGPKNMRIVKRGYEERKMLLQNLIAKQQLWNDAAPSPREVAEFQSETLRLISLYVRNHRADTGFAKKKIFTNLLVKKDDDYATVVSRSDTGRIVPVQCPKQHCTLAWETLRTGKFQFTGDLHKSSPTTPEDKQYQSVLTVPVWYGGTLVGVVSIDSEEKHHFDRYTSELDVALAPYVQLIASTLSSHYSSGEAQND